MAQTYGQIITRVLRNVGDTRSATTTERALILQDFVYLLRHDLPARVGEIYTEGSFTLTLGGPSGSSDGEYTIPDGVRSFRGPFTIDGDLELANRLYRSPARFWQRYDVDAATARIGRPEALLIEGLTLHFRPIPDFGGGAPTYAFVGFGTLWPTQTITENTAVPRTEYEAILEAGATVLHASRNKYEGILQIWSPIWERWLANLTGGSTDYVRPAAGEERYI